MTAFLSLARLAPGVVVAAAAMFLASLVFGAFFAWVTGIAIFTGFVALPAWRIVRKAEGKDRAAFSSPPGLLLWIAIGVSLILMTPHFSTSWDSYDDSFALLTVGLLLWALAGTIWLVRLALALASGDLASIRARWLRWLMPFVAGVLGLVLVAVMGPMLVGAGSFTIRFELSRPAFDDAAGRARSGALSPGSVVSLGLFTGRFSGLEDGNPSFYMGSVGYGRVFIVELPDGVIPVDDHWTTWTHLDGRWWLRHPVSSD